MESQKKMMVVFGLVAAVCLQCVAALTAHVLESWSVPPIDFDAWKSGRKFEDGDTLTFKYEKPLYDVVEVAYDTYDNCNNIIQIASSNLSQIASTNNAGLASVTLFTGEHHFTCPSGGHCQSGLKVSIIVSAPGTSPGSSPSAPSTSTTSTSPAAGAGFVLCSLSLVVGLFV